MIRKFVNRKRELEVLEKARLFVVHGRRRVGKTALLRKFLENKRYEKDVEGFSQEISSFINAPVRFESSRDAFKFLREQGKLIVILDEFPYLIEADKGIVSEFQEIVDVMLDNSDVTLILCGSSVGMMEREVPSYKSPLYGRAGGILKVQPFRFFDMVEWFGKDFERLLRIYDVTWGIPKYMEFFRTGSDEEIIANFFDPSAFLFNEARLLLLEELRNPSRYMQIIEAITLWKTRLNEIAQYTGIEPKDLPSYLRVLSNLGIIKREVPITERKGKRWVYVIEDEYFRFYHRFVSPHYEEIESLNPEPAIEDFRKNFNAYLGRTFEKVSREFLTRVIKPSKVGRWWHKGEEIDIVALKGEERKALLVEVKWKELSEKEARRILKDLEHKGELIGMEKWKRCYGLIAKKIENKESIKGEGFFLWDLKDFKSEMI
ncbi:DEXX-box atpase [Pyrococcus furiosus DSM 3638]|uniref:DEXX-box atpase n=1 Tax=Pyrococcus furiosus (strain ATCC 43587 / DSM 3638 / JCM 8422 / Vc1) TaxID=186497 RepID=Q8TH10_PYRFU|nr:ATP-binding protein [Pyrococcus furiosus]AAL80888.1 DEXX-box atpase [Pyrococcus furiosus DSM 3638]